MLTEFQLVELFTRYLEMTPEEIKTLGHAFFDGKTLQYNGVKAIWEDWPNSYCPSFREGFKWRIKPNEPKKVKLLGKLCTTNRHAA